MQLDEFVQQCLEGIMRGINSSKKLASEQGFQINPWITSAKSDSGAPLIDRETRTPVQLVEFDVAVTTTDSQQSKAGAGILVASIGAGGQVQKDASERIVSRIRFAVPLAFPMVVSPPLRSLMLGQSQPKDCVTSRR